MPPIPKRSAQINLQVRNKTDDNKVEELMEYFKEELSKIRVMLSSLSLQAGQSGGTCDTQKEMFDFIKEERESSRILRREILTPAGENIDLRERFSHNNNKLKLSLQPTDYFSKMKYQISKRIMILNLDGMCKEIETTEGQ